mmetsp:Transcript_12683/g.21352  ORF Transcript_12683/g.21352 Transcript_12683/m.21352 type:complete len:133 (+) Transcript_12683:265-663(+)
MLDEKAQKQKELETLMIIKSRQGSENGGRKINSSEEVDSDGYDPDSRFRARFTNYDEKEESTCLKRITFYKKSFFMTYFALPVLSVGTAFILPLFLYWYLSLRLSFLYTKSKGIDFGATHVLIEGFSGNKEV